MKVQKSVSLYYCVITITFLLTVMLSGTSTVPHHHQSPAVVYAAGVCQAPFISISQPLNDLGLNEYVRPSTGPTGVIGGLYPNGANTPPPAHKAAGIAIGEQIVPLSSSGQPDTANGRIVMISVGMSNTNQEFDAFIIQAGTDSAINPHLVLVNGARGGMVSSKWIDPNAEAWNGLDNSLADAGVTPAQVQIAWVKLSQLGAGDFPEKAQSLQNDLEIIARILKTRYPNIKIAYHSSRTRAYDYLDGLSPEPTAFETGFAVKWLIEKQINGDLTLNYDPSQGAVLAPYLAWGPYLWIDGLNPRSDGLVWTQADVEGDCIHPSPSGEQKVANQLITFFKNDPTAAPWFLGDPSNPLPAHRIYLPMITKRR